jgi:hypothetical protein
VIKKIRDAQGFADDAVRRLESQRLMTSEDQAFRHHCFVACICDSDSTPAHCSCAHPLTLVQKLLLRAACSVPVLGYRTWSWHGHVTNSSPRPLPVVLLKLVQFYLISSHRLMPSLFSSWLRPHLRVTDCGLRVELGLERGLGLGLGFGHHGR